MPYFFSTSAISHTPAVTPREQRVSSIYPWHTAYANTMELVIYVFVGYLNRNIWDTIPCLQRGEQTRKTLPHKTQGIFRTIL